MMNPVDLQTALWHPGVIIHAYQAEVEMLKATTAVSEPGRISCSHATTTQ